VSAATASKAPCSISQPHKAHPAAPTAVYLNDATYRFTYLDYDWALNARRKPMGERPQQQLAEF